MSLMFRKITLKVVLPMASQPVNGGHSYKGEASNSFLLRESPGCHGNRECLSLYPSAGGPPLPAGLPPPPLCLPLRDWRQPSVTMRRKGRKGRRASSQVPLISVQCSLQATYTPWKGRPAAVWAPPAPTSKKSLRTVAGIEASEVINDNFV